MAGLRGIDVILYDKIQTGTDDLNAPIYEETPVTVHNVLVAPVTQAGLDEAESSRLEARGADYIMAIPKGDSHAWAGCTVEFFGEKWDVVGIPSQGIDDLIPGPWNKKVAVERHE